LLVERRSIVAQIEHNTIAAEVGAKQYQEYLVALKTWQENRNKIEGDIETEGTIKFCENELDFIDNRLPTQETQTNKTIFDKIKAIYDLLSRKTTVYKELYAPIEEKLSKILGDNTDKIEFETTFKINSDFVDKFLSRIKQNVDSVYKGRTEGIAEIEKRIRECDFADFLSFESFVKGLLDSLFSDVNKIEKLLKDEQELFEYISKLEYIKVQFSLKMDDKSLSELSPGQRGNVLLVFYLALNKKSEPLIIDQPEDNLDNQSVYNKLVPCIREAKKHRQVIIVTHNPNIAVACDAEQIICAQIEKATNHITYTSGSIENPEIKKQVIDVLEGTMPAFELRRIKYIGEVRK
jgi:DNA repair exonuclease SbcCD ATPase subunit